MTKTVKVMVGITRGSQWGPGKWHVAIRGEGMNENMDPRYLAACSVNRRITSEVFDVQPRDSFDEQHSLCCRKCFGKDPTDNV